MIGIYAIENKVTGECYVGQSRNIPARFQQHISMLERGEHHSVKLQRAYDSRGIGDFTFKILELCDPEQLDEKESEWIAKLDAVNNGYNMREQPGDTPPSIRSRLADTLYRQFKRECMEYGLTIAEAIGIIIDREIEESRRNIDLLESLRGTISEGSAEIVFEEEEETQKVKRTVRYSPQGASNEEIERVKAVALQILEAEGNLPGRRRLSEEAGATEWTARRALAELKEKKIAS